MYVRTRGNRSDYFRKRKKKKENIVRSIEYSTTFQSVTHSRVAFKNPRSLERKMEREVRTSEVRLRRVVAYTHVIKAVITLWREHLESRAPSTLPIRTCDHL